MLAYTGLETVANYASETREPGKALPRGLFAGLGTVVVVSALLAVIGLSAYPVENGGTALGEDWRRAPLVGIAVALDAGLPDGVVDVLRVVVGLTGAVVLVAAATTSISGAARLAYSLARYEMLPRPFARLNRRTLISPVAIVAAAGLACVLVLIAQFDEHGQRLPREPLQLRDPVRVHGCAGGGDPAAQRPSPTSNAPSARRSTCGSAACPSRCPP